MGINRLSLKGVFFPPQWVVCLVVLVAWRLAAKDPLAKLEPFALRNRRRRARRSRFPRRPWLDVITKVDMEEEETKARSAVTATRQLPTGGSILNFAPNVEQEPLTP